MGFDGVDVRTRVLRAATSVSSPSIFMLASAKDFSAETLLQLASPTIRWASWNSEAVSSDISDST